MLRFVLPALLAAAFCGCSDDHGHDHDHEHEAHEDEHHAHEAVFGGALVELGKHYAHLEFVSDADEGTLTIYPWGAHMSPVELKVDALAVAVTIDGETVELRAKMDDDALTGQTYVARHEALKGKDHVAGKVKSVTILGKTFTDVAFDTADHADHGEHDHE